MTYALILALALSTPVMADDCLTNWMNCTADSPLEINSFTLVAAGVVNAINVSAQTTTAALKAHKITKAQAEAILDKDRLAKSLWNQAREVCKANDAGNCPKNSAQAFAILANAQKAMQ